MAGSGSKNRVLVWVQQLVNTLIEQYKEPKNITEIVFQISGERMDISINVAETAGYPYGKREIIWNPNSHQSKKSVPRTLKDLNVKTKICNI